MKIDIIPTNMLGAVRQRLGAENEYDCSRDKYIEKMTATEVAVAMLGWYGCDERIGKEILANYEQLKKIQGE